MDAGQAITSVHPRLGGTKAVVFPERGDLVDLSFWLPILRLVFLGCQLGLGLALSALEGQLFLGRPVIFTQTVSQHCPLDCDWELALSALTDLTLWPQAAFVGISHECPHAGPSFNMLS